MEVTENFEILNNLKFWFNDQEFLTWLSHFAPSVSKFGF